MFEQIARMWRYALAEKQTGPNETVERRAQLRLGLARHRRQQGMRELPPDRRPDLRHLPGRARPSNPRYERCEKESGDREGRVRTRRDRMPRRSLAHRLQNRLRAL